MAHANWLSLFAVAHAPVQIFKWSREKIKHFYLLVFCRMDGENFRRVADCQQLSTETATGYKFIPR